MQPIGPSVIARCSLTIGSLITKCITIRSRVMSFLIIRVWLAASLVVLAITVLPPYILPCKKSDPDLDQCITNTIEGLRSKLADGIPELGAPPIEPLKLSQVRLLRGPIGARLDVNLTEMQVRGPSTFEIHDLKADIENSIFTFKVSFGLLNFRGRYQIDARLLLLQLTGKGEITGNFTGYTSDVVLRGHRIFRDGVEYLNFDKMKLAIKIGRADVHLSNLFGGDPILGPVTNQVLNANSALFVEEVRPVLETSLADLFTDVANKVTSSFTYKELFPA